MSIVGSGASPPAAIADTSPATSDIFVRYDMPAPDITDAITGYHVYARTRGDVLNRIDWFLPGTANMRFVIDAGPLTVQIGTHRYDLPTASLFGPTSRAMKATSNGGYMVGIGVSAIGWARLGLRSASSYRDRIVPLAGLIDRPWVERLAHALAESDRGAEVKPILDAALHELLGKPHPDELLIHRVNDIVVDNDHDSVARAAAELDVSEHTLRRISTRYFGLTPKLLLSRARFLRAFLDVISGEEQDYDRIGSGYHDVPHFLRDARRFLGMTPRQFHLLKTPFLDASLKTRPIILGAVTQALHRI